MTEFSSAPPAVALSLPFRVAALSPRKPTRFDITASAAQCRDLARDLGLSKLDRLTFKGEIRPQGRHDYVLIANLDAQIMQPCSVSLQPVRTVISETVRRVYLADFVVPVGDEVEMPEDDTVEPLPETIDAGSVATEALTLSIPLYPRAPGVELQTASFAEPGVAPLQDGDLKPFASLAALKARMTGPDGGDGDES